jgi:VIT family
MSWLNKWVFRHLDPASRLNEVLFGLIMALGFTGAVRLGLDEPNNRELFISILGCNIAWGIVDGVMYVLGQLFERGRKARVVRDVLSAPNDDVAKQRISKELDGSLMSLIMPEQRATINQWVLELLLREKPPRARITRADLMSGLAIAIIIILSTLPVVVPYLAISHPETAVRVSNLVALALVFLLGCWWGKMVGATPWKIGFGLTAVGLALVLVTIALGG